MIHDKDYIIRIVKQFSEFLSKMLLNNAEDALPEQQRIFDTNMSDTFRMDFATLSAKPAEEILDWVAAKEASHQVPFLELLGHVFYVKGKASVDKDLLVKSKIFYETYLQQSGIFSIPIMNRINDLKNII